MAPSITAGMIVPAFTSYGDTGMRTEAGRYSGGRSLGFVSTRRAPRPSEPDAVLDMSLSRVRSAGMTMPAGAAAGASGVACLRAAWPAVPRSKAATLIGARSEEHTSELQSLAYLVCR